MKILNCIFALCIAVSLNSLAFADSSHGKGKGHGVSSKPSSKSGLIKPTKHVYYQGDVINISLKFPHNISAFWDGDAEAKLLIYAPDGSLIDIDMTFDAPDTPRLVIEDLGVDTSTLLAGDYQLALILTNPGGNPSLVSDWYNGYAGLLAVSRIRISEGNYTDDEDTDGDGEFDGDTDGDGFDDSADDSTEPTNSDGTV